MRLFIAIPLPPDVRRAALEAQRQLRDAGAAGRFVPDENFHITLHFIGESDALLDITEAMRRAARDIRPFVLRLTDYGSFAHGSGRTAFVAAVCDGGELDRLYESLEYELSERGFAKNRSRLTPHITLGRNVTGGEDFTWDGRRTAFRAGELALYESRRTESGMRYTAIHRERLS